MNLLIIPALILTILLVNHFITTGNELETEERWDEYEEEIHMS